MHEEELGRFGHHPDPAIDFEVEVETIQGSLYDATHGVDHSTTIDEIRKRIAKAMEFRVGGDAGAVAAKQMLRGLEMEAAKHAPSPLLRAPVTDEELEQWAKLRADDAGHLARELVTYRRNPAPPASVVGSSGEAERFRLLARHYMKALGEIAIEDDRDAAQLIACEALGSNPSPQVAGTPDLIKALSRLTDSRHSDGVSSLVSAEDRGAIINGCYDLMVASRQAPAPQAVEAPARHIDHANGKIYVFVSEDDGIVTFKPEGGETLSYLGRAEFDKRFKAYAVLDVTLSAETVIAIRDALIANDVTEAYYQLYQAVDPTFSRFEPWADTEAQLRRAPADQAVGSTPVAWRYRHVPTVSWSYSTTKHPRQDLEQEPLFVAPSTPTEGSDAD
ncbi:hypothetical protein [Rhizobium leguminosarum]|uniref:hypothetical protein n=1 Tax=Rhizobium leguminosarum TaxID=384 RepID=UPI001C902CEA|nr:hypothetical protein [Rhizobium leguminosarum]MBY2911408.1 hypothetical protein [Rhizobium leguminosarum]